MASTEQEKAEALHERVTPEWYYWIGVVIPGALTLLLCVNRTPEFGASVWIANAVVLVVCAAVITCVTYWKSNTVSALAVGIAIIGGSLVLAGLSHVMPVLGVAGGALWTGSGLGLLVGIILTSGERR